MKTRIINVPQELTPVKDNVTGNVENKNKFHVNLQGIVNLKSREWTMTQVLEFAETWKILSSAERLNTDICLPEDVYKKLLDIIRITKGWGEMNGQLDIIEAFEKAEYAPTST